MTCLRNPQWEKFAREFVELSLDSHPHAGEAAYKRAGYMPHINPEITRANARKLRRKHPVAARIRELFAEAFEYADVRLARVITRIDRVARANVADFYEDDGRTLKDIKKLPRELSEALKSVKCKDDGSIELELHDKNQANFVLLKHLGGLAEPERPANNILNLFGDLSVDDQRIVAEALEAVTAGPAGDSEQAAGEPPGGRAAL